jgi:hypothetical protein
VAIVPGAAVHRNADPAAGRPWTTKAYREPGEAVEHDIGWCTESTTASNLPQKRPWLVNSVRRSSGSIVGKIPSREGKRSMHPQLDSYESHALLPIAVTDGRTKILARVAFRYLDLLQHPVTMAVLSGSACSVPTAGC